MSKNSGISWTHHTFNPVWGCAKVSPGCTNCYADNFSHRYGHDIWGYNAEGRKPLREFGDKHWAEPLKWNKAAEAAGERHRVFCASMADAFDEAWPEGVRERLWALIRATPHLDWLLLTKRPANIPAMLPADWGTGYTNVWLGTSVENQKYADERIPLLLAVPAVIRFLSCEPLLGEVDLSAWMPEGCIWHNPQLHWVIVGGESGTDARPMHPAWAWSLLTQCKEAGISLHFKQWGAWAPDDELEAAAEHGEDISTSGTRLIYLRRDGTLADQPHSNGAGFADALRRTPQGRSWAMRRLDGMEYDEIPEVRS